MGVRELYDQSVKPFVVCTLELYLSLLLMVSLFQCPDPIRRDEQELHTTYYMAWVPLLCTVTLLYSAKLLGKYGPDPDNLDRNLMGLKILMWLYAFVELVLDKNMVIKRGPALYVAIIFCACDMLRFQMEVLRLIYDDEELEEEVDRLANMVIGALENDDDETAFKHAVREVIQRNRELSADATMQDVVDEGEATTIHSPFEKHDSVQELPSQQQEEDATTALHHDPL
ncbi:Microtubule-associated protein RP/EB family member 1 [Phytophthora cinnamomi]|uniref:Microtubule-associated protein RP/EB family member 1 n=1 Tax=Phytophthora cinnamomi TaxID=4785 RepID=UPI00355A8E93|nr:Microtubule-associated protein RP/EB family member 1 [Phytophthora cinnamomi]